MCCASRSIWTGLPVNLIDTAGLRQAADVVEAEGVRRAFAELRRADRVLYLLDAAAPAAESSASDLAAELNELPKGVPVTLIFNKIDLSGAQAHIDESRDPPQVFLSAKTGAGTRPAAHPPEKSSGFPRRRLGSLVGAAPPSRCAGACAILRGASRANLERDAGVRAVRRRIAARSVGLGRNHRRIQQRRFAGRNLRQFLHRQMIASGAVELAAARLSADPRAGC